MLCDMVGNVNQSAKFTMDDDGGFGRSYKKVRNKREKVSGIMHQPTDGRINGQTDRHTLDDVAGVSLIKDLWLTMLKGGSCSPLFLDDFSIPIQEDLSTHRSVVTFHRSVYMPMTPVSGSGR